MKTVYLAGPITGCSFNGCTDWRKAVAQKLRPFGILGVDPMRAKDYLKNETAITGSYEDKVMSCQRGIMTRDRYDATHCDVLLVNFLGANRISIGTVMEIAWADAHRIPIICAIENDPGQEEKEIGNKVPNVHDHPMIREAVGFRVPTLDEAVDVAIKILGVGRSVGCREVFSV
jgi:nucleoside 2-deoxyribosyltransferase